MKKFKVNPFIIASCIFAAISSLLLSQRGYAGDDKNSFIVFGILFIITICAAIAGLIMNYKYR